MGSDNPSGADNQQERPSSSDWLNRIPLDLGNWVAGFVDGEGSFNVPIRRERDRSARAASVTWRHRGDLEVEVSDESGWQEAIRRDLHNRRT